MTWLSERMRAVVEIDPSATAIHFDGDPATWGDVGATMRAVDDTLVAAGVGTQAEVAVVLRNRPPHLAAALGLLATERCLVTVPHAAPDDRIADDLAAGGWPVVASADDWARGAIDDAVARTGVLGLELTGDPTAPVMVRHRSRSGAPARPGVAVRMLTSGTTGPPKRIDLSYRAIEESLAASMHYQRDAGTALTLRRGATICWAPLGHISGLWGVVKGVTEGRATALLERFDVHHWAAFVREHRPSSAGLAPAPIRMILDAGIAREDLASLKAIIAGTAPTPPELVDRFLEVYGIPILVVYGATEFAGAVAGWTKPEFEKWWGDKRGSVGRAHPGVALRIVDPATGAPLPAAEVGLLEVRGAQLGAAAAEPAPWVRTSDIARLDDDGFLYIEGRADDTIIRGGFKVSPTRVADVLRLHPAVHDAGVVGIDDERLGAVPAAAVELRANGAPPTEADLLAFARSRLAAYEVPVRVTIVDELPRTPSLKVSQPDLRALLT